METSIGNREAKRTLPLEVMLALSVLMSIVLMLSWNHAAQAQNETEAASSAPPVGVTLEAPAHVAPGQVIPLTLRLQAPAPVAGFEAEVRYDPTVAEFASFSPALPQAAGVGRLTLPDMASGAVVGAYTCATGPCLAQREVQAQAAASDPTILAVVEVLPLQPGALELAIDHLRLVDAQGNPLPVALAQSSLTVQVGETTDSLVAPASLRPAATAAAATAPAAVTAALADVTQDGQVSHVDVMEVALVWQVSREDGTACVLDTPQIPDPRVDINADGCVDVSDVQSAAALATAPEASGAAAPAATTPNATTAETLTVDSILDEADAQIGDGLCATASNVCTLRAAIQEANAQEGANTIHFNISGDGVHTIQLTSRLPTLSDDSGSTFIDGYSQPGASPNTDPLTSNAQIRIELRGEGSEAFDALAITTADNRVRGLAIYNVKRPFWLYGAGAQENVIVGNLIGTDAAGTFHLTSTSKRQAHGVHLEQGANHNRVGGAEPGQRNVIGGNARHGVGMWHVGTEQNRVLGNIVGLSPDGQRSLPNRGHGIDFNFGAARNVAGGTEPGEHNVISGNIENGVEISHAEETAQNRVIGNYIGTDVNGDAGPAYAANTDNGIMVKDRARNNVIAHNVIGNNNVGGIFVDEFGNCCTAGNVFEDNRIGIGINGGVIPNQGYGVRLWAAKTRVGPGNIIAYNGVGIEVDGDENISNTITQNSIFENVGLGIDLEPFGQVNLNDAGDVDEGPNQLLNFPVLKSALPNQATGTACSGCRVEVFIADGNAFNYGQGKTFVGAAVADASGNFTATLENVPYGQFLTATATDEGGNTSEFSQNMLVNDPSNRPPTAQDDTALTITGRAVVIDVLANDTDPENDALSVTSAGSPSHGTAVSNGAFVTYTPNEDYVGEDQFTYMVTDSIGGSSTATVTVTVEDLNISGDVVMTPTTISLIPGGGPATYSMALGSQPSAPVTITVVNDGQLQIEPQQIVFDANNWDTLQTITIRLNELTATEEDGTAATRESILYHLAKSDDPKYNNLGLPTVTVQITDPDETHTLFLPLLQEQK